MDFESVDHCLEIFVCSYYLLFAEGGVVGLEGFKGGCLEVERGM